MSPRNRHNNWQVLSNSMDYPRGLGLLSWPSPILRRSPLICSGLLGINTGGVSDGLRIAGYLSGRYRQRASSLPPILIVIYSFLQVHLIVVLNGH